MIEMDIYPGQTIRAGSESKALEIAGTWNQYSHQKLFGFFTMISDQLLPETRENSLESTGKKSKKRFRSEYCFYFRLLSLLSCRIRGLLRFFPGGSCGIQWLLSSTWDNSIKKLIFQYRVNSTFLVVEKDRGNIIREKILF